MAHKLSLAFLTVFDANPVEAVRIAAPGMDESALANEVLRRFERLIKQKQGRSMSDVAFAR